MPQARRSPKRHPPNTASRGRNGHGQSGWHICFLLRRRRPLPCECKYGLVAGRNKQAESFHNRTPGRVSCSSSTVPKRSCGTPASSGLLRTPGYLFCAIERRINESSRKGGARSLAISNDRGSKGLLSRPEPTLTSTIGCLPSLWASLTHPHDAWLCFFSPTHDAELDSSGQILTLVFLSSSPPHPIAIISSMKKRHHRPYQLAPSSVPPQN